MRHENYPRCEAIGQSWIDAAGTRVTHKYYHYMWAEHFDAERRMANETRQNLASNCKEIGYLKHFVE